MGEEQGSVIQHVQLRHGLAVLLHQTQDRDHGERGVSHKYMLNVDVFDAQCSACYMLLGCICKTNFNTFAHQLKVLLGFF